MTPQEALQIVVDLAEQNILDVDEAVTDETLLNEIERQREAVAIVGQEYLGWGSEIG